LTTHYANDKYNEIVKRFQLTFEQKLKSFYYQSEYEIFFDRQQNNYEEYDFERDIIDHSVEVHNNFNNFVNLQNFKDYTDDQNQNTDLNRQNNIIMHVVPDTLEYKNIQRKETSEMESGSIKNECSLNYPATPNKRFGVIKKEICLRSNPPFTEKVKPKLLQNFNIKFTKKRENIDKKVLRKFRKFLKNFFQKRNIRMADIDDSDFWTAYINEELYPSVKFRCLEDNRVYEFKSCNTNYMAWIFSMKNAEQFYGEFIREKGYEFFQSIVKKNQLARNDPEYEDTKNYIFHLATIFNLKKTEQNIEYMPENVSTTSTASTSNTCDIFDEMLEYDVKTFINEESYYNIKKSNDNTE